MDCFLFQDHLALLRAHDDVTKRLRPGTSLKFKSLVAQRPNGSRVVTRPALWDADDPMRSFVSHAKEAGYEPQFIIRLKHFNRRTA